MLTAILIAAELAVLARLSGGLWRRYPVFALAVAAGTAQHAASLLLPPASYLQLWHWSTPVLMAAQASVVLEIFSTWSAVWRRRDWRIPAGAALAALGALAWWSAPSLPSDPLHLRLSSWKSRNRFQWAEEILTAFFAEESMVCMDLGYWAIDYW